MIYVLIKVDNLGIAIRDIEVSEILFTFEHLHLVGLGKLQVPPKLLQILQVLHALISFP